MGFSPTDGPQYVRALQRANRVRCARALIKRRIASGELTAAEVILSDHWELESMRLAELLLSQPRWGSKRCGEFLLALTMDENKRIGSMTERQRTAVAALLTAHTRASR